MNAILALMPESWRPYAKAVVTAVATLLVAVSTIAGAPTWIPVAVAFLGSLGVYGVPNETKSIVVNQPSGDTIITDEGDTVTDESDLYYEDK